MKESEGLYRFVRFLKRTVIGIIIAAVAVMVFGYAIFMRQVDARGAWQSAARELNGGMLRYGERVEKFSKAYQRRPSDYYRASNGLLVATNRRLIFVGISPKDKLQNEDAPQTVLQYEFPNDTLLTMRQQRLYALSAHGVRVGHPSSGTQEFASSSGDDAALDSLIDYVDRRLAAQRAEAVRERRIREAVAALMNQPIEYVVRRGDAISTIASRFDTTPELIQKWNGMTSNTVRIGERLIVKQQGPRQAPDSSAAKP